MLAARQSSFGIPPASFLFTICLIPWIANSTHTRLEARLWTHWLLLPVQPVLFVIIIYVWICVTGGEPLERTSAPSDLKRSCFLEQILHAAVARQHVRPLQLGMMRAP